MRAIGERVGRLERQLGVVDNRPAHVLIVTSATEDYGEALDVYVRLLTQAGRFQPGVFSLCPIPDIPEGMSKEEAETYFREHGLDFPPARRREATSAESSTGTGLPSCPQVVIESAADDWGTRHEPDF